MTSLKDTYQANTEDLTVYYIDKYGEAHDLNATGQPINSKKELIEFIDQLKETNSISGLMHMHLIANVKRELINNN